MNMKTLLLGASCLILSGCANLGIKSHKDLKAPCGPVASNAPDPCGFEIPLNTNLAFNQWKDHERS